MLMGETYDARLEMPGWDTPGFDDAAWDAPSRWPGRSATRPARRADRPARADDRGTDAQSADGAAPGTHVFDLGQNMVGWARLKVQGPAGTVVRLRFGEMVNPDGTLYVANLRSAKATDTYILKGGGVETWEPNFTFHGFRYVEADRLPRHAPGRRRYGLRPALGHAQGGHV